jgi:tyrosine-protein kinase
MSERHSEEGIGLGAFLDVLRRRIGWILGALLLTAGGALGFSLLQDEEYSASASVLSQSANLNQLFDSSLETRGSTPEREAATNLALATQDVIARRAARRLGRQGNTDAADAVSKVEVTAQGESNLIDIKTTASDPEDAALAANAFAREYVSYRRDADRAQIRRAQRVVRRELNRLTAARTRGAPSSPGASTSLQRRRALGRRVRSLEERSGDLRIFASLQTGNAVIVDTATPPASPSSPKPVRNTVIGGFAGLLLGLGLAFSREQLDRRLRNSRDLEEAFGAPVLARLPASRALRNGYSITSELPPAEAEAFRMLRANLRHPPAHKQIDSVLITSPSVEDGKTTVALNLATAATMAGLKVLLLEADVRRPRLAASLGLAPGDGLTAVLSRKRERLADVTSEVLLGPSPDGMSAPIMLDVVPAGEILANASELIESGRMRELITEARRSYSLVIIDTPPAGLVFDAIPLMSEVSAVVVVGRIGRVTSDEASGLSEQLRKMNAPTMGVVANFTDRMDRGYDSAGYGLVGSAD